MDDSNQQSKKSWKDELLLYENLYPEVLQYLCLNK